MPVAFNERSLPLAQGSSAFSASMRLAYDFTGVGSLPLWAAYDYVGATAPNATQFQTTALVTYNGIPGRRYSDAGPVAQYDSTTDYGFQVGTGDLTTCILFSTPAALPTTSGYVDFVNFGNEVGSGGFTFRVFHDAATGWIINPLGTGGATVTGQGRTYIGVNKTVAVFIRRSAGVASTWRIILGSDASAQRINNDNTLTADFNAIRRLRFYDGGSNGADAPALHSFRFHNAALTNEEMLAYASDYWAVDQYASDATAPTFTGSITVGTKTSSSIALTLPTATDNVGVTGYEYRVNGGVWQDNGNSTAVSLSGLAPLTSYTIDARAYDAGPNYSTTLSVTTSTYRAGASAGSIVTATAPQDGNPAGFLYAMAQTLPVSDWVSYTITSGPTPAGGTLDAQANGAFSYTGPAPATMVVQPEVNGVPAAETITVTLYDQEAILSGGSDVLRYSDAGGAVLADLALLSGGADVVSAQDAGGTVLADAVVLTGSADVLAYADAGGALVDDMGAWPERGVRAIVSSGGLDPDPVKAFEQYSFDREVYEVDFDIKYLSGLGDTAATLAAFSSGTLPAQSRVAVGAALSSGRVMFAAGPDVPVGMHEVLVKITTAGGRTKGAIVQIKVDR